MFYEHLNLSHNSPVEVIQQGMIHSGISIGCDRFADGDEEMPIMKSAFEHTTLMKSVRALTKRECSSM